MAQPFIYIGTYTIKDGRLEDFKRMCAADVSIPERCASVSASCARFAGG